MKGQQACKVRPSGQTTPGCYWNGEPCRAHRVIVRVGKAPQSTWWCADMEGAERRAVMVIYQGETFFLDDEDGSGWRKVTAGKGSPWTSHSCLPTKSAVLRSVA